MQRITHFSLLCLFLFMAVGTMQVAMGQESGRGDEAMERWLAAEERRIAGGWNSFAGSKEEWEQIRPALRQQYLDMLGLWPVPAKTPLKAQVTGKLKREGYAVENVHFQSKPGLYVTGNLYLPDPLPAGKLPTVLYVCGHSGRGRDGNKTAFQHHGQWFATHGFVCLVIDTLQLGEVAGIHHGTYRHDRWWWHSAGYTSAGVECWNGVRALDYLITRPEVDAEKLAVTGISGGGAATFWITAADERVKVCVPVSGMSDLESYVTDKVINGHCDCMFLYNTYRWEWSTIAALVVPRPMLFENSGHDTIFPMGANERIRVRLEKLYNLYQEKPGQLFDIGVTPGGHEDNLELRLMAYRFISKHLKGDNAEVQEPPIAKISGAELRVFPTDADLPKDSLNDRIDESFVTRADIPLPKNKDELADTYTTFRSGLDARVFRDWPDQVDAALVKEQYPDGRVILATDDETTLFAKRFSNTTASDDPKKLQTPKTDDAGPDRLWLVVLGEGDKDGEFPEWARPVLPANADVTVVSPRGIGEYSRYLRKNPPNYVERSHALLGRTVDTLRVWDIQATARYLHETAGAGEKLVGVVGRKESGVLGAYAAHFDSCIADITLIDPPASHMQGPTLLNVLRVCDIGDTLGFLAPRRVTLIGAKGELASRVRGYYNANGSKDRLKIQAK